MTEPPDRRDAAPATLRVFSVLWALAALFHLLDATQFAGLVTNYQPSDAIHAVVAVAALLVLLKPGHLGSLALLAAATLLSAWVEAPVLGSHWLLESLIDIGFLVALLYARQGRSFDRRRLGAVFFPTARVSLLCFYSFAAFSKLNSAFVDSHVSCANFFAGETIRSLGLPSQWLGGSGLAAAAIPYATIAVECSVPLLLLIPKTRHFGVGLALAFHSLIGLDLSHPFSDFSMALAALFLLFLPGDFWTGVHARASGLNAVVGNLLRVLVTGTALGLVLCLWIYNGFGQAVVSNGRNPCWILADATILLLAGAYLAHRHDAPEPVVNLPRNARWTLIVPALVVANGLTPYLELKTSYAWNMYSNLVTANGSSNHLLVRSTAHLTDFQDHPVSILSSDDPYLQTYADQRYAIPLLQLRAYLAKHSGAGITYSVDGVVHTLAHAGDNPALVSPPPAWEPTLFAFRALDEGSPNRCQTVFLPLN
jgi:hypothetical protein